MDNNEITMNVKQSDVMDSPNVICPECGCPLWEEAIVIKMVSGFMLGVSKPKVEFPIPVHVCRKCGCLAPKYLDDPNMKNLLTGKTE